MDNDNASGRARVFQQNDVRTPSTSSYTLLYVYIKYILFYFSFVFIVYLSMSLCVVNWFFFFPFLPYLLNTISMNAYCINIPIIMIIIYTLRIDVDTLIIKISKMCIVIFRFDHVSPSFISFSFSYFLFFSTFLFCLHLSLCSRTYFNYWHFVLLCRFAILPFSQKKNMKNSLQII